MMLFKQLTQTDEGIVATTPDGELLDVGNSDGDTVEASIIVMGLDLTANLVATLPQSVVGGGKGTASVVVGEAGTQLAAGTFRVELFASSSPYLTTGQAPFGSFPEKLSLKEGKSRDLHLKFQYPASLASDEYYLLATVVPPAPAPRPESGQQHLRVRGGSVDRPAFRATRRKRPDRANLHWNQGRFRVINDHQHRQQDCIDPLCRAVFRFNKRQRQPLQFHWQPYCCI